MRWGSLSVITGLLISGFWAYPRNAEAKTLLEDYLKEKNINVEVSASLDFYDKYVWRGLLLDGDPVLQPSVTLSGYGFEGGFWGSWDVDADDNLSGDETDGWIGYGFDLGFLDERLQKIGISFCHTWYGFPETNTHTKEFNLTIALDTLLSPYFKWYRDYGDEAHGGADGNYFMLGISHGVDLNKEYGVTLDVGQEINYNDGAFIKGTGGYSLTVIGITIPLTENTMVSPKIAYSVPMGDLAAAEDGAQKERIYGGISLAVSF